MGQTTVEDPEYPTWGGDFVFGTFLGKRVEARADDLVPIKNRLPPEIGASLKTKRQWEELGLAPNESAQAYFLHPTCRSTGVSEYYLDEDVPDLAGDPLYPAYKERLVEDLREATGSGGLSTLEQRREREEAADPDLPVKNLLPEDEKDDFKTASQWMELGFEPKRFALPVRMRPSKGRRPCSYFRSADVEPLPDSRAENCVTCSMRGDSYFCPFAGERIGRWGRCSEWEPRNKA